MTRTIEVNPEDRKRNANKYKRFGVITEVVKHSKLYGSSDVRCTIIAYSQKEKHFIRIGQFTINTASYRGYESEAFYELTKLGYIPKKYWIEDPYYIGSHNAHKKYTIQLLN